LKWKYGKEEPPPETAPKTLAAAKAELAMIARMKSGDSIVLTDKAIPEKSDALRVFNVFVDDEYFEVGVEEVGGEERIQYVKTGATGKPVQPKVVPEPTPAVVQPASKPESPPAPSVVPAAPPRPSASVDGAPLLAPMPGTIVSYEKKVGDVVAEGDTILILEAMKMENALPAPVSGVITSIDFKNGDSVAKGDILCVIG
jgi:oxaloacetate decarboxylase alpha subunit/pyruvate carboxylase subunit B